MEANVEQHHAFQGGLETFIANVRDVLAGKEEYDGAKIVAAIDSFGAVLTEHLSDEIPTIVGLRKFGVEKLGDLGELMGKEAETNMVSFCLRILAAGQPSLTALPRI